MQEPPEHPGDKPFTFVSVKNVVCIPEFLTKKYGNHLSGLRVTDRGTPGNWTTNFEGRSFDWIGYCLFGKIQKGETYVNPT